MLRSPVPPPPSVAADALVVPTVGTTVGFLLLRLLVRDGFWGGCGLSLLSVKWEHRDLSAKGAECLGGALLHVTAFLGFF